jgi:hypothetical protein
VASLLCSYKISPKVELNFIQKEANGPDVSCHQFKKYALPISIRITSECVMFLPGTHSHISRNYAMNQNFPVKWGSLIVVIRKNIVLLFIAPGCEVKAIKLH